MIGADGEAAVVDPRRDVETYLEEARAQGLTIRHVIETHLHADFVSGHRELAERTGAKIYFGAKAGAALSATSPLPRATRSGWARSRLRFLETPGHTPESISILVFDRRCSEEPQAVLTGDTLFIGDVGRPDLLGARMSARSSPACSTTRSTASSSRCRTRSRCIPAHGAGSLCGRNISSETSSTIGQQRRFNYALQPMAQRGVHPHDDDGPARGPGLLRPRRRGEPRRRGRPCRASEAAGRSRPPRSTRACERRAPSFSTRAPLPSSRPATCPARCTWASRASSRRGRARCFPPGSPSCS